MAKTIKPLVYQPKALIPGYKIEAGLEGLYVAVPDRGYKGKAFTIKYWYQTFSQVTGDKVYGWIEKKITDWQHDAVRFRRFPDKWGRGTYTLAYFKVADRL